MLRRLCCAVAGVLVLLSARPKSAVKAEPILVGEVAPLTGRDANYGQSVDRGVQLAFEQVNARGGVHGRPLALRSADDQSSPEEAAKAAKALVDQKVVALLGDVTTTLSLAVAPVAQQSGVPLITPSSTSPKITQAGDYIFQTCFTDAFQGRALAGFARNTLKMSKVAVIRDAASEYSTGLADTFVAAFKEAGGEIVGDESYQKGSLDFRRQLGKLKEANPQAIFVPGYDSDVAFIARQAREIGIAATVPLLGGDGWDSPEVMEMAAGALDGSYFSNHYSADDTEPRVRAFVKAYEKRFKAKPDAPAAMGYDAALVLADALGRAADLSGASVRAAIAATKGFPGVTGTITVSGGPTGAAAVMKVKRIRTLEFVTRVSP